jgi:hypothetical protein
MATVTTTDIINPWLCSNGTFSLCDQLLVYPTSNSLVRSDLMYRKLKVKVSKRIDDVDLKQAVSGRPHTACFGDATDGVTGKMIASIGTLWFCYLYI